MPSTDKSVLWCVNIHGPDDVVAVASYLDAVKVAKAFNDWWLGYRTQTPLDELLDARMWAVPIEWPHAAEDHAISLAAGSPEYDGFIKAALLQAGKVKLPASVDRLEKGNLVDADGDHVAQVDVNRELPDAEVEAIAAEIASALNGTARIYGPYGHVIMPPGLTEADWKLESDPVDAVARAAGYRSEPLFALRDLAVDHG
jgi:hypothetical protein